MKKYLLVLISTVMLFLTGCNYYVTNNIKIYADEQITNDIWVTHSNLAEEQTPDIKNLLTFLLDLENYSVENQDNFIYLETKKPINFDSLKYIKRTVNNGITTLEIKIPPLVSYKDYEENFVGATMYFRISLHKNFEYIDSNSLDVEDVANGKGITWELSPKILSRGTTLTLKYKKK